MKTDDLISALSTDAAPQDASPRNAFFIALGVGALIAGGTFFATLGPRPDFMAAMHTMRFDFKFVVTIVLAVTAFLAARD
ncbi:MAG TPA: NrsF family protein, partial [Rhizomicrobium sp.]|nr:NrsF family protein [Rhizomicrobium sp.]